MRSRDPIPQYLYWLSRALIGYRPNEPCDQSVTYHMLIRLRDPYSQYTFHSLPGLFAMVLHVVLTAMKSCTLIGPFRSRGLNTRFWLAVWWSNHYYYFYAKYHVQIMLLFVYTTTCKRFVIFTCRYFKLSWNTTSLSQSNSSNFSCSSVRRLICRFPGFTSV